MIGASCFLIKNYVDDHIPEEKDSDKAKYSIVTCVYVGEYDYVNNADIVTISSKKKEGKYIRINAILDDGAPTARIEPGDYSVHSDLGAMDMTIDNYEERYIVTLDYDKQVMEYRKAPFPYPEL